MVSVNRVTDYVKMYVRLRLQTPLSYLKKARKWRTWFTATMFYYYQCRIRRWNAFVWFRDGSC